MPRFLIAALAVLTAATTSFAQGIIAPTAGPINSSMAGASVAAPVDFGGSYGMVQILGFSGNSTDRPHASTVEVLFVVGPMAGSGTLVAVKAQYV